MNGRIALQRPYPVAAPASGPWLDLPRFMMLQILCQVALLIPGIGPFRIVLRMAAFGASILLLWMLPKGECMPHPAARAAVTVLLLYVAGIVHPNGNTIIAAAAQVGLNAAILAPIFWVSRLQMNPRLLRSSLLLFWCFHCLSSVLGVVQTYFPGQFQPAVSTVITANEMEGYMESLMIETASGEKVYRPMGLTDIPGGAGNSGYYTVLLGIGFFLTERSRMLRTVFLGSMMLGLSVILLSQVRAILVMLCLCLVVLACVLVRRGEVRRLATLIQVLAAVAIIGVFTALYLGGDSVTSRLETLVADDPTDVYKRNRGGFLTETIEVLLPQYPLGAGLGRWGMMNAYFGDNSNPTSASIWAEIQWTGWVLDGGLPLTLAYVAAIFVALWTSYKVASMSLNHPIYLWGGVILAYNFGVLALTFSYPVFIGASGMEFWLLNSALYATYGYVVSRAPRAMEVR